MDNLKIQTMDIETLKECAFFCFYVPSINEWRQFEISQFSNQLYEFVRYCEKLSEDEWLVTFNGVNFDGQVITWILDHYERWIELSAIEVAEKIWKYATELIDRQNYNLSPDYREWQLFHKQIDVFKINHLDNENRRSSLKWCEFSMDWWSVEEMPIHHSKENLSLEDIEQIKSYCRNDVLATWELFKWTIGECEHPEYKGRNKVQDRLDFKAETGMECMNWSDVKIGEEWNKKDYMKLSKRKEKDIYPRRVRQFFGMKYKQFFPNTVEFTTPKVKEFVHELGETFILNKKQEFKIVLGENNITLGRGGIHSAEKPRMLVSDEKYLYVQTDIGSQYPNAYLKYGLYPAHLGKPANEMARHKIERRLSDKELYKKTKLPKYKSLSELGKYALNGGLYGKLRQRGSFLEDPICQLKITMGCQLEILMITEALIEAGFKVVSLNTDGFDTLVERMKLDEFYSICKFYEKKIGNDRLGNLEFTEFDWIVQTSVNDYIALKADGDLKKKGDFSTDVEIHKNKSRRIVPLALEAYYSKGISPDRFIPSHKNIYDFMIGVKANRNYHYETYRKDGTREEYKRLVRYFVSENGNKLLKIKNEDSDAPGNAVSECEAPDNSKTWLCTVANQVDNSLPIEEYRIDYEYYIRKANKIILSIERGKKITKEKPVNPNQLSLQF